MGRVAAGHPGCRVPVAVEAAQHGERGEHGEAEADQGAVAALRREQEQAAGPVAARHDAEPGQRGVSDVAMRDAPGRHHQGPEQAERPEIVCRDVRERIVAADDDDADREHGLGRQRRAGREQDEAGADRPDHLQEDERLVEAEPEADPGDLERDQPEAARDEELHERAATLAALALEIDGDTGEQHEGRRAEVRDPAGGKERDAGLVEIGRREEQRIAAEEVAHMVEDHQDDDEASQLVDDLEPRARSGLRLGEGVADDGFVEHWRSGELVMSD